MNVCILQSFALFVSLTPRESRTLFKHRALPQWMSAVTLLYSRDFCYCFLLPIGRLSGARRVASGSSCLLFGFDVVAGAHFAFCPCPVRVSWTGAGCIRAAPAADLMVDSVLAPARCVSSFARASIFACASSSRSVVVSVCGRG